MRHWYLASLLLFAACSSDEKESAAADTGSGADTADTTEASGDTGSGETDASADATDTTEASGDAGSGDTGPTFDLTAPLSWPVGETGPFVVGYRRWETTYTSPGNG